MSSGDTAVLHGQNLLSKARSLAQLVGQERAQVILSLQTYPNLVAIVASMLMPRGIQPKVVISERNLVSMGVKGSRRGHRAKIRVARWLYRFADGVVAISHPVAAELVSWFSVPPERCVVVPNPATAKTDAYATGRMRQLSWHTPITLVLPARLVAQKQPLLAVETAAELTRRGRAVRVLSFGSGELRERVATVASRTGVEVEFAGWVEDWCSAVPENSVVVLPSQREGFGNVLVEAASIGVPSVALSGALGTADAVIPGITGELSMFADPNSLADAVERCVELEPTDVAAWLSRFSVGRSTDSLVQFLERTLA
jgi:glycosyltransferase involved in cell wall biosynthesis